MGPEHADRVYARIPRGSFAMGSLEGQDDEAPIHVVTVDAFELAIYPVTRADYATFLSATRYPEPRDWHTAEFHPPDYDRSGMGTRSSRRRRRTTISVG
jgi:formylglycine-generating enzyme required for sulfatase activity